VPVGVVVGRQVGPLTELAVEDSKADPDRFLSDGQFLDKFVLFLGVDGYVVGSFVAAVDERTRPQSVILEQFVAFMGAFQIGPSGLALELLFSGSGAGAASHNPTTRRAARTAYKAMIDAL